ncbi:MAG: gamma-glutamyl-gamma-aminobutyrate hydrolase family protein [Armatimonadota bacterium]|nr:MAG: gamma-glutamyl-gamma-aminobutyrate hydrolase family protein [Armatimonadota bacterium]
MPRVFAMSLYSGGPTIGITLPSRAADREAARRAERKTAQYRRALEAHGARAVERPPESALRGADGLDGLLLTGGGDMHASCYGRRLHPKARDIDRARDEMELQLCREALVSGMPILGICRGAQVLGVALGGELVQDIESKIADACQHAPGRGERRIGHWVTLAPGSRLREIMGVARVRVNSSHHQANGRLGASAAAARSEDGVIEGIEGEGVPFVIGVQWHPERMWRRAPRQRRLFAAFTASARAYADGSRRNPTG